jgi:SsrA-binding protein
MRKQKKRSKSLLNRRARHDYALDDSLVVGMELTGRETKALRMGQGSLQGAYVTVQGDELMLVNALISGQGNLQMEESEKTRTRRLLAKRREINQLIAAKQQGKTIVPLEILTNGRFVKLRLATGKGKKKYDKRQTLKKRDELRQIRTVFKTK